MLDKPLLILGQWEWVRSGICYKLMEGRRRALALGVHCNDIMDALHPGMQQTLPAKRATYCRRRYQRTAYSLLMQQYALLDPANRLRQKTSRWDNTCGVFYLESEEIWH